MVRTMLEDVRALLIDLDGVLYVEEEPIAGAAEAIRRLRERGPPLRFVTNTTAHSRDRTLHKLARLGLEVADRELITPAALAVRHCRERGYHRVALIMNEEVKRDFKELQETTGRADAVIIGDLGSAFGYDVLNHAFLPAMALLITTVGTWILTMRNTMISTLAEDYVRMARAKGLPGWRIMLDYAARNSILPNLVGFAMSLGFVVSGAILIEYVFNYPGVGFMLLQAVSGEDYPLMQALFLLITVAVLFAILAADILTAILDPRTRAAR